MVEGDRCCKTALPSEEVETNPASALRGSYVDMPTLQRSAVGLDCMVFSTIQPADIDGTGDQEDMHWS